MKQEKTFEERILYSTTLKNKYPDRVPVIIEKDPKCKEVGTIEKNKYLLPKTMHLSEIIIIIRKNIKIDSSKAIFMFINGLLLPNSTTIGLVYHDHVSEDGFLYITYRSESTFG